MLLIAYSYSEINSGVVTLEQFLCGVAATVLILSIQTELHVFHLSLPKLKGILPLN